MKGENKMKTEVAQNITEQISVTALEANDYRKNRFFKDNLEHLEYLEYIARFRVATAYLRNKQSNIKRSDNKYSSSINDVRRYLTHRPAMDSCDQLPDEITLHGLTSTLEEIEKETIQKVQNSIKKGVELNFDKFCSSYGLDDYERIIVTLFFANNTGKRFREFYEMSEIDPQQRHDGGMSIGAVLSIIFPDYRDQIANRKYFSIDSTLMKHEIIVTWGSYDETTNILDEKVYLHERIVRFIIGDDNVYDTDLQYISRNKSSVKLEQVILSDNLKQDILELANNYSCQKNKQTKALIKNFYGYGTGMIYFFFGPSGTGKTMLAHALANAMDMDLLTMNAERTMAMLGSFEDRLKHIFKEAKLCNGIVFFDECDDVFRNNDDDSRSLLIEIEKTECITILATNKVVDLDPALDRRITMKVPFHIPNEPEREIIWETLVPPNISIGEDVDFKKVAKNYIFSGGLIKNALFMAITNAMKQNDGSNIVLTSEIIEQAAHHQTVSMFDLNGFGEFYTPDKSIDTLPLRQNDKKIMHKLVSAYNRFRDKDMGMRLLLGSSSIQTGIDCVEAVAKECGLKVKKFNLNEIIYNKDGSEEIKDPFTQKKITLMDYVFSTSLGHQSLTLLVDYGGSFSLFLSNEQKDWQKELLGFSDKLRKFKGLLFIVTKPGKTQQVPFEFDHYFEINTPPEELQICQWEKYFDDIDGIEDNIVDLVERYPLHMNEIDFLAQQSSIVTFLDEGKESITLNRVYGVIKRYMNIRGAQMLFGNK